MYADARRERRRDLDLLLHRLAWRAVLWLRTGLPEWEDVALALSGKVKPPPSPEELLQVAKRLNKFVHGELTIRGESRGS